MKKKTKLKYCDWSLLFLTIVILASGVQLEINLSGERIWVWLHIAAGILFMIDIFWHLGLHHNRSKIVDTHRKKHPWLGGFFILTLLSGIIATCYWYDTFIHSTIGGIHGKFGFLMILAVIIHICHHIKFYRLK